MLGHKGRDQSIRHPLLSFFDHSTTFSLVMKASDLPQEILQNIFYYLEEGPRYYIDDEEDLAKRSLLQLQLTCKLWSQVAREVFYQKLDLRGSSEKASLLVQSHQVALVMPSRNCLLIINYSMTTSGLPPSSYCAPI